LDRDLKGSLGIMVRSPAQSLASLLAQKRVGVPAKASTTQQETRGSWVNLLLTYWGTWGTHALALADQAVVSGASFLTTVVIGRWTFPSQLGVYSIGISLLISSLVIQESLILVPYTIQRHRLLGAQAERAGSSLAQSGLLSALGIVVLVVTALGLSARDAEPTLVAMTWALAAVLPFTLLREFGRRFAFAHLQIAHALILDSAVAAMQLAGLGLLAWTGRMSAAAACGVLGAACALSGVVWLYLARADFAIHADHVRATMKQSWGLGKWLFVSQINSLVKGYITYWLLGWIAGASATGVYAACMSVVLFANPFIQGLGNIFGPKAALVFKEGGGARLRREVARDSLLLGVAMTLFCSVVLFAGEHVMRFLYPGNEYEGNGHTVTVLALALLASAVGMPASNALESIERPREVFWAGLFAAVLTAALVWSLVAGWGLLGAAYGFLAGNVAGAAGLWVAFLASVQRHGPEAHPQTHQTR
jgi:O-antigen/teichoic acid export membrane protein